MKVPFIDLKRFESGFLQRWQEKVSTMTANAEFIGGSEVAQLENALKSTLEVNHAVTCANGTDALQLALRAMGVGRGDVVLVPNLTFWATFEAVVNVGADPVTVDVDQVDGAIDFSALERALIKTTPKVAIIVHLYGWGSARLSEIRALCLKHNVILLEDGAQSYGALYQGESIYKDAYISTTSFYPAKVLGGAGDGGAIFTKDRELADRVRRLANHGRTAHYGYGDVGWNSRLDSFQAAFLNISLDYIEARIASRRQTATFYQRTLPNLGLELMVAPAEYVENGYSNVCLVREPAKKNLLEAALRENNIGFGNIYPDVISRQDGATNYIKGHFGGENGEAVCASVLNLPIFPYMTDEELNKVVSTISGCTL